MTSCPSCGTANADGAMFCVKCGTTLSPAPSPESWRAPSGDLNQTVQDQQGSSSGGYTSPASGGYTPPSAPPSSYPAYTPQQNMSYQQPPQVGGQPMHPAIPALVSLFFPGLGLLFVPNKAGLGIGIFAAYAILGIVGFILTFVIIGICLLLIMPLANIVAAVHSWDESAKATPGGQFQPILFK